jgi:hypothetical protein
LRHGGRIDRAASDAMQTSLVVSDGEQRVDGEALAVSIKDVD